MKPFISVARPHDDVLRDTLELDVFAANIWNVYKGDAPPEYQDPQIFESKTYQTRGLENIVDVVRARLEGRGGDPVIQLQTPFGGGKTHALIALYHMARDMDANVVVLAGDAFDASEVVLWEEMERQLTGDVSLLGSETAPGVDKIKSVLVDCQPVLILVDELLEYAVKAAGRKVGDSSLASQLLAFMQELSVAVSSVERASLVVTLPSSVLEHYDENAEKLFQQLSKVLGRIEKIYAPVADDEIYAVIRRRLFKSVDEDEVRGIVEEIVEKLDSEDLLPEGLDVSDYRRIFMESYPFQPEVIEVLYERWGSFPNFQRTRGVLRLLSLVVNSLRDSSIPFIRLSDFDLSNDHIKREFIRFIGNEYDSVIASDITGSDSGSKIIDSSLKSYAPYRLGTHIATTIFLYSFSGGERNGATLEEIKRSCIETEIPMAIISDTLDKMRERLFYLHKRDGLYYFSNKPNLIRIHTTRKENVTKEIITGEEKRILGQIIGRKLFESYIWPRSPADIPDNKKLKLIVCKDKDECNSILEMKGENPRVYKNTLIFLVPAPEERGIFEDHVRDKVAWENIYDDSGLEIPAEDRIGVKNKIEDLKSEDREKTRNLYPSCLRARQGRT
ncbi:MAG: ATP-binding protein [Methanomassiliicoccales archaeon]|nr:ATP-binding protein [Methanomassiliicoccales archaeon]